MSPSCWSTADSADRSIDEAIPEVLKIVRERMRMDVVFVSEFTEGRRVIRHVSQAKEKDVLAPGVSDPLESTWCQRVVDGRIPQLVPDARQLVGTGKAPALPYPVGSFLSTPLVLQSGEVYGTLCCLSFDPSPNATERSLKALRHVAQFTAAKMDRSR